MSTEVELQITSEQMDRILADVKPMKVLPFCQKNKLAILGTAATMPTAPYDDPEFELWGVAQLTTYPAFKRADVLYELHTAGYWKIPEVLTRLNKWPGIVVMQDEYPEVLRSVKYPIEDVLPYRRYHTTSITYMLAWAYHSFVQSGKPKQLSLFGVHMEAREEYTEQRPGCEYWLGRMEGAGMQVTVAGGAVLADVGLYGYENYDPMCHQLKQRIAGLQAGVQVRMNEEMQAKLQKHEQIGAIKEAEYWLRLFQTGQVKAEKDGS